LASFILGLIGEVDLIDPHLPNLLLERESTHVDLLHLFSLLLGLGLLLAYGGVGKLMVLWGLFEGLRLLGVDIKRALTFLYPALLQGLHLRRPFLRDWWVPVHHTYGLLLCYFSLLLLQFLKFTRDDEPSSVCFLVKSFEIEYDIGDITL
jgi:hypothetical protein